MKRIAALLLALALTALLSALCLAEGPAEPTVLTLDVTGQETLYRLYDRDFYEADDEQAGTVVRLDYTSDMYGDTIKRWTNVYLPYGYDENGTERYPVIYFFHGNGCDQNTLIGNYMTKNAFDHMISSGICEPFILVTPTYYYNSRHKLVDLDAFVKEIREELMPAVEGTYRTYAETADDAGFIASRDKRAFCGFSRGSFTTWFLFDKMLDYSYYFLPFAGTSSDIDNVLAAIDGGSEFADSFFIYMASGGPEDTAYEGCVALAKTMIADTEHFSFGTDRESNNFYYLPSDNIHQDLTSRYYLYNAFIDVLFR